MKKLALFALLCLLCPPAFAGCTQSVQLGTLADISTTTVSASRSLTTISVEVPGAVYEPDVCANFPAFCKTFQCLDGSCTGMTVGDCWSVKIENCHAATFAYEVIFVSTGACP